MSIDLHIHSSFSDGSMTPEELVFLAKRKGLLAISITDHDNVDNVEPLLAAGKKHNLKVVPGLELSVIHKEVSLHLLAYLFDYKNHLLLDLLDRIQTARKSRNSKIIARLKNHGIDIEKEIKDLSVDGKMLGRPHIAKILLEKKIVNSIDEAFKQYLIPGGLAYVKRSACPAAEAIRIVHEVRGLAVLAHPLTLKTPCDDRDKFIDELVACGLDGIETYYPTHSQKLSRKFERYAEKNGLICTGGSDYHGTFKVGSYLAGGKNVFVPEQLLDRLYERHDILYNKKTLSRKEI